MKLALKVPRFADRVYTQVAADICDHQACSADMILAIESDGFENTQTMLSVDPDQLKSLIEMIVKVLFSLFFPG
jgi:hypothetical protein